MMRSGRIRNATAKGAASASVKPIARFCAACAPATSPAAMRRLICGQQHGAGGDADHADRELVEPIGVVERRHRAGRQERGDDRVGEHRDLHAGRADDRGPERLEETPHRRRSRRGRVEDRRAAALRRASAQTSRNSRTPAAATPQAAACPAVGNRKATASAAIDATG